MRALSRIFLFFFLALIINTPSSIFALGEYDGVWVGMEKIVFMGEQFDEITGAIIYQGNEDTLFLSDDFLGTIRLVRSGNQWILPSPLKTTFLGVDIIFNSVSIIFQTDSTLTGTINGTGAGSPVTASLSHTKQSCQTLSNGIAVTNLSGGEGSIRCYEIELLLGSTNLHVQTMSGGGDCDIILGYSRPDFDSYLSENDGNNEDIIVDYPNDGKWYTLLIGYETYSGLELLISYDSPLVSPGDNDGDGDVDGVDLAIFAAGPIDEDRISAFAAKYGSVDYL